MTKTILVMCVLALTTVKGSDVRSVKFQDVLHAVARKAGYSPESGNFLSNQAIAIGEYISEWMDRLYTAEDWPEWTKVVKVVPDSNHIVPYSQVVTAPGSTVTPFEILKVLNVYLVDPKTTSAPVSTPFTLREEGIHVGFEHGTYVWIKYIEPPPDFTAKSWEAGATYQRGEVVYANDAGECFRSKINNNSGNDPTPEVTEEQRLGSEVIQTMTPDSPGTGEQPQILRLYFGQVSPGPNPADPPPNTSLFAVAVFDEDGVSLASTSDGGTGVKTISQIMDTIRTDLLALLGGGWTITNNGTNKTMDIENASKFSLTAPLTLVPSYFEPPPDNDTAHFLKIAQVQPYIPSMSGTTGEDQVIELTITNANLFPGATYTVTFRGQDGQEHTVNYVSLDHDGVPDVLAGILAAMTAEGATDDFFLSVFSSTDGITAQFRTHNAVSMDATVTRAGSPYWELVPFPKAMFNPVVRGASADLMGEWGQTDKQTTGESKVPMPPEEDNVSADFQTTTTAALTTQQKAHSRYKY